MFKIEKNVPGPSLTDNQRMSRHSIMNATAQMLQRGESFEVMCANERDRIATHKALYRFRNRNGIQNLMISRKSQKSFRVYAL